MLVENKSISKNESKNICAIVDLAIKVARINKTVNINFKNGFNLSKSELSL